VARKPADNHYLLLLLPGKVDSQRMTLIAVVTSAQVFVEEDLFIWLKRMVYVIFVSLFAHP
jgi:hypothetical protein